MTRSRAAARIGLICDPGHDVFSVVAETLERRGFRVAFFEPGRRVAPETIAGLGLLANKKVDPESFRALRAAERRGVATWNGYTTVLLGTRLVGLAALEAVGFDVPTTTFELPDRDYVAKSLFDWHYEADPELNGRGALYQEYLPTEPIDFKYYAVDDGDRVHVRVLRSRSKLYGEKAPLGVVAPEPAIAAKVRRLMRRTDSQAIGVDVIESRGRFYAVDVNPAMSFRHVGMEALLADSMAARATEGTSAPEPRKVDGSTVAPGFASDGGATFRR